MMPRRSPQRRRMAGFTLLELLVALFVLGFLLVALNHGVRTGLGIWDVQTRRVDKTWDLDATVRVVRTLLTQISASPTASINRGSPGVAIAFAGNADKLNFVGELPTGFGTDVPADVRLELLGKRLVMNWRPHRHELSAAPPAATTTEILRGVDRLELAYWGPSPAVSALTWLGAWEGPNLPDLVRIRLWFSQGDPRRWPDLIVAPRL